jgi:ankyrin repeat protein
MKPATKVWKLLSLVLGVGIAAAVGWVLLDQKRQLDQYDLMAAATRGNVNDIAPLLAKTDVNGRLGGDGETALHRASANGRLEAVRFLVEHGADVNAVDGEGGSPLLAATYRGHKGVVEFLLSRGAAVNAQETRHGFTPLIQAVSKSDKDLVVILLAHKADVSLRTSDGRTAIDRAAASGSEEILAMLKAADARKNGTR